LKPFIKFFTFKAIKSRFSYFAWFVLIPLFSYTQSLPSGFYIEDIGAWNTPTSIAFDSQNNMYVAERAGKVYALRSGVKTLVVDLSEEVSTFNDQGMLGLALDPNFLSNGRFYVFYSVDRHHLLYYGTPSYNSNATSQGPTICRVTRYEVNTSNYTSLVANSRYILIGETISTGIPMVGPYHAGGDLKFAKDGSLLIAAGDGALDGEEFEDQAYSNGIINSDEYAAGLRWRCQILNSLNGKLLRINPINGEGYPSNPYYQSGSPKSPQSRTFALGLRNPFRMNIKANTGSSDVTFGDPGIVYLNDVGQDTKEEINVVTTAGQNFGWPRYEGIDLIYGTKPAYHPATHERPRLEYPHSSASVPRAIINNQIVTYGTGSFTGPNFTGSATVASAFYTGTKYPAAYQGKYFFCDFGEQWVKYIGIDQDDNPGTVSNFSPSVLQLICLVYNPNDEYLYFTAHNNRIGRINYNPNANQPPVANFSSSKTYGSSPLTVAFDGSYSSDPELSPLTYSWNFGDGQTSTQSIVNHTFTGSGPSVFNVTLSVTDNANNTSQKTQIININNTPPQIISTGIDNLNVYEGTTAPAVNLTCNVADAEHNIANLTYTWEVFLYHNTHRHLEYSSHYQNGGTFQLSSLPCDDQVYFYRIFLTVTDPLGLSTVFSKDIYRNCNSTDLTPPENVGLIVEKFTSNGFTINWNTPTDNDALKSIEVKINGTTITHLANSITTYLYKNNYKISGQEYTVELVFRDKAANVSSSPLVKFIVPTINCASSTPTYLSDLVPTSSTNGFGPVEMDQSNGFYNSNDGTTLKINNQSFAKGIGVHAISEIEFNVAPSAKNTFSTTIGIDDEVGDLGTAVFKIYKDNVLSFTSGVLSGNGPSQNVSLDITGTQVLKLRVEDGGDNISHDHGDWADAKIYTACINPDSVAPSLISQIQITGNTLSWNASSDAITPSVFYKIYVDGVLFGSTSGLNFSLAGVSGSEIKIVHVQVFDDFGNTASSKKLFFNPCQTSRTITDTYSNITETLLAKDYITGSGKIQTNANIIFSASKSINLMPGFSVENGSVFKTLLEGCL
jgi:glucose/arabinose dehydrogenase